MDNKKLMHILLRDVSELEQLIQEIRLEGSFDTIDMELLHTRISGVRHLLEIAGDSKEQPKEILPVSEKQESVSDTLKKEQIQPDEISGKKDQERKEALPVEPQAKKTGIPAEEVTVSPSVMEEAFSEKEIIAPPAGTELTDESEKDTGKPILADKFVAGKSVNDILLEKSKNGLKHPNIPLSNLAGAIGTNERFLFTRELFEGDMESFSEAINKLDKMHNIQEAADFLRENFKWKKNETSLRFIDLVKRRFIS